MLKENYHFYSFLFVCLFLRLFVRLFVCFFVCLFVSLCVIAITQERIEIQPRALKPDGLSSKARPLLKFSPLAQFLARPSILNKIEDGAGL